VLTLNVYLQYYVKLRINLNVSLHFVVASYTRMQKDSPYLQFIGHHFC